MGIIDLESGESDHLNHSLTHPFTLMPIATSTNLLKMSKQNGKIVEFNNSKINKMYLLRFSDRVMEAYKQAQQVVMEKQDAVIRE